MTDPPLPPGFSRETTLVRDAEGRWFHDGVPLDQRNLARAFDRWITRADDGRYCLKNEINWAYVTLHGAPFFVRAVRLPSPPSLPTERGVVLVLSNDRTEALVPGTLRLDRAGALYCDVGDGSMVARFDRHATMQLEPLLAEDEQGIYLRLGAERLRPPVVDDPLVPHEPGSAR